VERATPSVVIEAKDSAGRDVPAAAVQVDSTQSRRLDGKAFQIDPGPHTLQVEAGGLQSTSLRLIVREGEQNRRISVTLIRSGSRAVPKGVYLLGATGVVALGLGTAFGVKGLSNRSSLDDRGCKPNCPTSDVDSIRTSYLVSEIALGAGAVALGAATWWFVSSRNREPGSEPASRTALRVQAGPGGVSIAGAF
jgi:hypothetical protein